MYEDFTIPQATALQNELAKSLKFQPINHIRTIAGTDISFDQGSTTMYAGIVILTYPEMVLQSFALATYETSFPYEPGYLMF